MLGGAFARTIAGAVFGAFTALPAGATAALTLWSLVSVSLHAFTPLIPSWRHRLQVFRVIFGVLAGGIIGLQIALAFALLGGAAREASAWILIPTVAVLSAAIAYPPRPHKASVAHGQFDWFRHDTGT